MLYILKVYELLILTCVYPRRHHHTQDREYLSLQKVPSYPFVIPPISVPLCLIPSSLTSFLLQ